MGLFNYSKPGPGISKDAPKKKGIFLYFELFGRKLSKLISVNLIYLLCSIPMILLYFLIFLLTLPNFFSFALNSSELTQEGITYFTVILSILLSFLCTATLGSGPASASLAYIFREYSKEEHVWLWSTFFEKMKENFKQEMVVAVLDLIFVFFSSFAFGFYFNQYIQTGSTLWFAMTLLLGIFSALFVFMHYYIHQLIVTFENKLKDILKNSLLFVMSTLLQCILLSAFIIGIMYLVFIVLMDVNPVIPIAVLLVILISFLRFPVEFYVHSAVKKILKLENKEKVSEEEVVFSDTHGSEK